MEFLTLNTGAKMPLEGFGVFQIPDAAECEKVTYEAIQTGYRLIDTAKAYADERGVGEGIRNCGVPREELFVVSKVAAEHKTYEEAKAGIDGRGGMPAVFDGLAMQHDVTRLKLIDVKKFDSDAVWIRYQC